MENLVLLEFFVVGGGGVGGDDAWLDIVLFFSGLTQISSLQCPNCNQNQKLNANNTNKTTSRKSLEY